MRADEYVVNELQKTQHELENVRASNVFLRQENKELLANNIKMRALFECEQIKGEKEPLGYRIIVNDLNGYFLGFVTSTYQTDPSKIEKEFLEWLEVLNLELPKDLEQDQELVEQAMEKAKELQEAKKND